MAYNEKLAERIRAQLSGITFVEKKMFGGAGFLIHGNMACGVHKNDMIVRVDPEKHKALLKRPHAKPFDITGRPMKGWLMVEEEGCKTATQEYGSLIIHSMETGIPRVVYGNVANRGLIDNLPQGCCVEVPCLVDKSGLQPTKIGMIPPHLAAMQQTNINVQSLVVEAAPTRKREYIYHAAMLDPHTAAELSLDQIWSLVDELIEAHGDILPEYQ